MKKDKSSKYFKNVFLLDFIRKSQLSVSIHVCETAVMGRVSEIHVFFYVCVPSNFSLMVHNSGKIKLKYCVQYRNVYIYCTCRYDGKLEFFGNSRVKHNRIIDFAVPKLISINLYIYL